MRCLLLALLIFPSLVSSVGGETIQVDRYCSFNGGFLPNSVLASNADQNAMNVVNHIMQHTGLPSHFKLMVADVDNAVAILKGKQRYILYNKNFMSQMQELTHNSWAQVSILAHEIGHHLIGHTFEEGGSRPQFELEADRFSGYILQKMGASIDDAVAAMRQVASVNGSRTHPRGQQRLIAIADGWKQSEGVNGFKQTQGQGSSFKRGGSVTGQKPVDVVVSIKHEPTMVFIPGGMAAIGCLSGRNCRGGENARTVRIPSFHIGKYEVTFEQWDYCVSKGGCSYRPIDEGWGRGKMPVTNVSWHDAQQYVKWLSGETGQNYSLPTNTQWEYAARAGARTAYIWGNSISCSLVSYNACRLPKTTEVGSFGHNKFKLHDMLGNVSEWTQEQFLRGGAWGDKPDNLRLAYKFKMSPNVRGKTLGFRIVKNIQ